MGTPASSFVASKQFHLAAPPARPRGRQRPADYEIGPSTRQVLIDRLERAIDGGLLDLCPDDIPCDALDLTLAELGLLLRILLPEEYAAPMRTPAPTDTAPGSAERIAEYARRVDCREQIFAGGDARADGNGRGLRIVQRKNGTGPKVVGWEDEESPP